MFIDQFLIMLSNQDDAILKYYISMDKVCGELTPHLNSIFTYLRNQAVHAVQSCNVDGLNTYATYLQRIINHPDGCEVFLNTQKLITSTETKSILFQYSQDYLTPFFGFHPADYFTSARVIETDISTIPAINQMRSQYIALMNNTDLTTVRSIKSLFCRIFCIIS